MGNDYIIKCSYLRGIRCH